MLLKVYRCSQDSSFGIAAARWAGLLAALLLATVLSHTSTAFAVWDGHCKEHPENDHCYALSEWKMKSPENVRGGVLFMTTTDGDVFDWENGSTVNDEMWVSWQGSGNWLESGQTIGNGRNCCSIWAFWAYEHNGDYKELEAGPVPQPTNHYIIQDPEANGNWCIYWGEYVLQRCFPGWYPATANQLEAGIEAADEAKPENEALWEVAYVDAYGQWHPWKGSLTESHYVTTANEMCITNNYKYQTPGNGLAWIC